MKQAFLQNQRTLLIFVCTILELSKKLHRKHSLQHDIDHNPTKFKFPSFHQKMMLI
nr:hypothetical protein Iba_chr04bCG12330 [Ipomoea batatas]